MDMLGILVGLLLRQWQVFLDRCQPIPQDPLGHVVHLTVDRDPVDPVFFP